MRPMLGRSVAANWRPICGTKPGPKKDRVVRVTGTHVQVLARPAGACDFQILIKDQSGETVFPLLEPGYFDGGVATVLGVKAYEVAQFYVRAWRVRRRGMRQSPTRRLISGNQVSFLDKTGVFEIPGTSVAGILRHLPSFTIIPVPEACQNGIGLPPLCLFAQANPDGVLLRWPDLGTNYVYTLEFKAWLSSTNWATLPGGPWPARTNQWTIEKPLPPARFYRVRAEKLP